MQIKSFKIKRSLTSLAKHLVFGLLIPVFILNACIDKFDPEIDDFEDLLVIDGSLVKGDSIQNVVIIYTSPLNDPYYSSNENFHETPEELEEYYFRLSNPYLRPVSECDVKVVKENGEEFSYEETEKGNYTAAIPQEFLAYDEMFKLVITTPNGNHFESDYEPILKSSPIDSIYLEITNSQSSSVYYPAGLQYYVDLKAPESFTKHYRWILEETWEYLSRYLIDAYLDINLGFVILDPPIDSLERCWLTVLNSGLYSSSTQNLSLNEKKKIPLNFVSGDNYKLSIKYSILVKQYALSDAAYFYWNKKKVDAQESGGLYQSQPSQSFSNIKNTNNPDELVLGYFWASSYTEKRIFFEGPYDIFRYHRPCYLEEFDPDIHSPPYRYFSNVGSEDYPTFLTGHSTCFNCTRLGGTTTKPDYW